MSSKAQARLVFDGPAVRDGAMDIRHFAPALLSTGRVIERANSVLNQDQATVSVRVRSGAEPGSFPFLVEVGFEFVAQLNALVRPEDAFVAAEILTHLGFWKGADVVEGVNGLIDLIKWLEGEPPQSATTLEGGNIRLKNVNADTVEITQNTYNLYLDDPLRESLRETLSPVKQDPGIKEFRAESDQEVVNEVDKDEVGYYETVEDDVPTTESEQITWAEIRKTVFHDPTRKWEFWDGNQTISAPITDDRFWQRVDEGERFGKGDSFKLRLKTEQRQAPEGELEKDFEVIEVLDHKEAPTQSNLLDRIDDEE